MFRTILRKILAHVFCKQGHRIGMVSNWWYQCVYCGVNDVEFPLHAFEYPALCSACINSTRFEGRQKGWGKCGV